jgi:hypothetical protein
MKEIWEDKGRWHAKYKHNYAITATQTEAENKVRQWKGLAVKDTPASEPVAPMHDEVVSEKEKIAGAIVEESILDADTDDDGVITREEIANWAEKHG